MKEMLKDMNRYNSMRFSKLSVDLDRIYKNLDSKSYLKIHSPKVVQDRQIDNSPNVKSKFRNVKDEHFESLVNANRLLDRNVNKSFEHIKDQRINRPKDLSIDRDINEHNQSKRGCYSNERTVFSRESEVSHNEFNLTNMRKLVRSASKKQKSDGINVKEILPFNKIRILKQECNSPGVGLYKPNYELVLKRVPSALISPNNKNYITSIANLKKNKQKDVNLQISVERVTQIIPETKKIKKRNNNSENSDKVKENKKLEDFVFSNYGTKSQNFINFIPPTVSKITKIKLPKIKLTNQSGATVVAKNITIQDALEPTIPVKKSFDIQSINTNLQQTFKKDTKILNFEKISKRKNLFETNKNPSGGDYNPNFNYYSKNFKHYGDIKKENNKKLRLLKLWGNYSTALDYKLVKLN